MRIVFLTFVLFMTGPFLRAQVIGNLLEDETILNAETKQVNQFFRRFNSEEDNDGERLYPGDPGYRDNHLRKQSIPMIFDRETSVFDKKTKDSFIKYVSNNKNPVFLNFHAGSWFAEVIIETYYYGKITEAHLFLKLQEEKVGSKWVLSRVYFEPFNKLFFSDPEGVDKFLHPMSHELDFINLAKVFRKNSQVEYYAYDDYIPDYLSIFIYEMKMNHLKFKTIKEVKFHFFQVDGFYFEIEEFNRPGFNSGWLISKLSVVNETQKINLLNVIYHEGQ